MGKPRPYDHIYRVTYYAAHRQQALEYSLNWQRCHPMAVWRHNLKRFYNTTPIVILGLLRQQKYRCAICTRSIRLRKNRHIDHDHQTKQIRGILCGSCNRGIGLLRESIRIMQSAIRYLAGAAR